MDVINSIFTFLGDVLDFIRNLAPHGFGLLIIPVAVLGLIGIWVARRR